MKVDETAIQVKMFPYLAYEKHHRFITPNSCNIFPWEADLLSVTRAGYYHEFEIKISAADFKADFRKESKHKHLKLKTAIAPRYFWYVICGFSVEEIELPDYAGLIEIVVWDEELKYVRIIKKAPRLGDRKITDSEKERLYQAAYYRFWREIETRMRWRTPNDRL